ncbi:MAG: SGNH/GDSL hydrolase family protein [Rhodospirillales bacterium]|nr:SGNH/GDSL hydrolase family protein [Rhodospirillales bacterium]MCB9996373.1 SGNH/GDSL hydrolase family protein [Rhodospirillales bacterium]
MNTKPDMLKILQWTLALAILLLGVYMSWGGKTKWIIIGNIVHALPLISLLLPWAKLRTALLWFGVFLILQDGYSLYTTKAELYKTLPPNMEDRFTVSGNILRGIEGPQTITTDAKGYRVSGTIDYGDDAPYRIFAIGASTTEQIYLDDRSTWTHLLQEGMGLDTEVINTGVSGLRAEHHLATLQHILPDHPDMVLFLIGVNDWNKHVREQFGSRHYQRNKFRYSLTPVAIRDAIGNAKQAAKKSAAHTEAAGVVREETGDYYIEKMGSLSRDRVEQWVPQSVDPHYGAVLQKIGETCKKQNLTCVFLSQPHGYAQGIGDTYKGNFWMTPPGEKFTLDLPSLIGVADLYNGTLKSFACDNGFAFIDLAAQIKPGFESFYDDVHFNTGGAQQVAAALIPAIKDIKNGTFVTACE